MRPRGTDGAPPSSALSRAQPTDALVRDGRYLKCPKRQAVMQLPTSDFSGTVVGAPLQYRESWLQWFWRTLRETANPNTMHTEDLTAVELEKQASFESLDYYKPYPDMYVEYLRESHEGRQHQYMRRGDSGSRAGAAPSASSAAVAAVAAETAEVESAVREAASPLENMAESFARLQMDDAERHVTLRWLLHVLIAFSVGIVATIVSYAVDLLENYRAESLYVIMTGNSHRFLGTLNGFVVHVFGSVVLAAIAAGVVVHFEPAASGGGIPDVMAYLNGVHLRKAMNLRTFIAKAVSCICAVAGGLPVGLEAPLIHLGAITGAGVTQGRSRTLGFQTSLFQAFRNNKDRRDFITAGAACGVSVAFGAPIGGLLFVMEEVSSFWDQSSNGQIFLATMLCFTFSTMINSIVEDRRLLGWVSNAAAVLFEVNLSIPLNLVAIVPSLLLGILIGSLAAFFTKTNLILIKWRRRVLRPHQFRRFLEPVVIAGVFSACMYGLSLLAFCAPLEEIADVNETVRVWGTESGRRLFNNTCMRPETYSPLGTLNMASGKNTVRHLFSRQTAEEFPVLTLIVYFLIYFAFACLTSGTAVSGGLVVPSLVVGAVFGRLFGLLLFKLGVAKVPDVARGYAAADAWMDPGVFALIGAGAFLAGTSRMSMAICVIMVELSAELHYLLPVMVAIVMSKTTADWLCEPLYHQMLHMDSVPYLPPNIVKPEFEQLTAADVMANDVITLRMREKTEVILAALRDSTHHAFPVVEAAALEDTAVAEGAKGSLHGGEGGSNGNGNGNGNGNTLTYRHRDGTTRTTARAAQGSDAAAGAARVRYKFVGLVTREDLQVYFTLPELQEYDPSTSTRPTAPVPLTAVDSDGFGGRLAPCVLAIRHLTWTRWTWQKSRLFFNTSDRYEWVRSNVPDGAPAGVDVGAESASFISENRLPPVLDLSIIVNRSPWVIPPFFNLQMAYQTFRMMGLRHMVVVDGDTVTGMITRKDLLVDALRRKMKELSARLATADSAAPSLPPSHTNRAVSGDAGTSTLRARGGEEAASSRAPTTVAARTQRPQAPSSGVSGAAQGSQQPGAPPRSTGNPNSSSNGGVPWKPATLGTVAVEASRVTPLQAPLLFASPSTTLSAAPVEAVAGPRHHRTSPPPPPSPPHAANSPLSSLFQDSAPSPTPPPRAVTQPGSVGATESDARASSAGSGRLQNGHRTPATPPALPTDAAELLDLDALRAAHSTP